MTAMTKQLTITWSGIPSTGLPLNIYLSGLPGEFYNSAIEKLSSLEAEGKTNNFQYNPLIRWESNSGMFLDKYNHYQSVRLWTNEDAAREYTTFLTTKMESLSINFPFTFTVTDIDPDIGYFSS
jgi:hypothetical protein